MTREIKFRAWDKRNRQMSESFSFVELTQYEHIFEVKFKNLARFNDLIWLQYTGLKDKNGKEIYHKDSCKDEFGNIWCIDWSDEYAGFELTLIHSDIGEFPKLNICRAPEMEIIGNIYENPELLKESK